MTNQKILCNGRFSRVMIDKLRAISQARAIKQKIIPVVAFLRKDGWSIACTLDLVDVTYATWPKDWTHFWVSGGDYWEPISDYKAWRDSE